MPKNVEKSPKYAYLKELFSKLIRAEQELAGLTAQNTFSADDCGYEKNQTMIAMVKDKIQMLEEMINLYLLQP